MRAGRRVLKVTSVTRPGAGAHLRLPLYLCRVQAGFPSPADDWVERSIDLNDWLIRNRLATYIVCVEGDSMSGEIRPGDRLIVDRSLEPRHGDVVIACVDGDMTVKRLHVEAGGRRYLVADNTDFPAVEINGYGEVTIWGVVTYSIRRVR
jgi:DNA polymerase V